MLLFNSFVLAQEKKREEKLDGWWRNGIKRYILGTKWGYNTHKKYAYICCALDEKDHSWWWNGTKEWRWMREEFFLLSVWNKHHDLANFAYCAAYIWHTTVNITFASRYWLFILFHFIDIEYQEYLVYHIRIWCNWIFSWKGNHDGMTLVLSFIIRKVLFCNFTFHFRFGKCTIFGYAIYVYWKSFYRGTHFFGDPISMAIFNTLRNVKRK